ncbi:26 proteasome-like protein complex subunit Sem1 [Tricharina praecox]|uniref:26 proteasome-like protein complex subunit Sem1 n=1 Tax=Tricharina praecox TaxID=43433 RepID=UPI002220D688|nr:26 proteasome-like protein complex subunit Sem1 [Tricharina praecox]KAI5842000.1 26 proteasome-like protein complex subunit Sem1 [Tricharina praecox]
MPAPKSKASAAGAAAAAAALPTKKKPVKVVDEDDEFEDFPAEGMSYAMHPHHLYHWSPETDEKNQDTGKKPWEETWDDDEALDSFSTQLKAEQEKLKKASK